MVATAAATTKATATTTSRRSFSIDSMWEMKAL
jgi:hypothetical protein